MIDELELYAQIDALQGRVVALEDQADIQQRMLDLLVAALEEITKGMMK